MSVGRHGMVKLQIQKCKRNQINLYFSMEGGELFNRIQERTAFNERGMFILYPVFSFQR